MTLEQMINEQQMLLNAARTQGRSLTAEEQARFNSLQRSIDAARAAAPSGGNGIGSEGHQREGESGEGEGDGSEDPDAAQRAMQAERTRIQNIRSMCRDFNVEPDQYIQNGSTEDQVRAAILEGLRSTGAPVSTGVRVTETAEDKYRAAAVDALLMRGNVELDNPADGARDLRGLSLKDMAIECLEQDGQTIPGLHRRSANDVFTMVMQRGFYNPTSAFPAILDMAVEKAYKEGHKKAAVTFDKFTKKGRLEDFKTHDNYYLSGPAGEFLEVPENGELKHDVFGDAKLPTRKLKTYGRQFSLSRQAFINDDIGLVTSVPAKYAASARKTINSQVFDILLTNPVIYDGAQLFGSAHKNLLASGTGITQEAVQTMVMALGNQLDQFGRSIIIRPAKIVCASGMEFDIYTLFNSQTINTTDNTQAVNPLYKYRESIEIIPDPTINVKCGGLGNVMPWFLFGDKDDVDGIEVDYLNGHEIPNIRRMEAAGQLGFVWDIYLDWGIAVMDYRGIVKNPGKTVETKLELA